MTTKIQSKNENENSLIVFGIIGATSNKQGDTTFKSEPRKSIYFNVDRENAKLLEDFGLTEYTPSKVDDEEPIPYFQLKMSKNVDVMESLTEIRATISGEAKEGNPNYTTNGKGVYLALFKGKKSKNEFTRVTAIMDVDNVFEETQKTMPFAALEGLI